MYPGSHRRPWQDFGRGPTAAREVVVGIPKEAHLRVLEEGVLVVDAAPAAVLQWLLVPRPGTTQPGLLPRLVDAQVRCVDQTALDDVREVAAQVLEGHPGCGKGLSQPVPLPTSYPLAPHPLDHSPHSKCRHGITGTLHVSCGLSLLLCKMGINLTTAAYFTEFTQQLSYAIKTCSTTSGRKELTKSGCYNHY